MKIRNVISKFLHIKFQIRKFNPDGSVQISAKLQELNADVYEKLTALKPDIAKEAHAKGLKLDFKPNKKNPSKLNVTGELKNEQDADFSHTTIAEINLDEDPQIPLLDKIKLQIIDFVKELKPNTH